MLRWARAVLMGISELLLTLTFWTLGILGYGAWERVTAPGEQSDFGLSDVRIALLLSAGFMALSGYAVTVSLLYAFYDHRQSQKMRAALNVILFLIHVGVFTFLVGSLPLDLAAMPLMMFGVAGVLAAEATTSLLWRPSPGKA